MSPLPQERPRDRHSRLPEPDTVAPPKGVRSVPSTRFYNTIEYTNNISKRFKACRICRKHKLKCVRNDNATCQRCHDNGVQCVYDFIGSRKRQTAGSGDGEPTRSNPMQSPLGAKSPTGHARTNSVQDSMMASELELSSHLSPSIGVSTSLGSSPLELNAEHLRAPVTAMHDISHYEDSINTRSKSYTNTTSDDQRPILAPRTLFEGNIRQQDIVSKGLIDQRQARMLFNTFMTNATNFLPIFDPILDSFESLRSREPFCLAVILTLAAYIEGSGPRELCLKEVKALVAESLFDYPASLGKVQGMVLLAVYGERTWFAIGHALQMALDLGLDQTILHEDMSDKQGPESLSKSRRRSIRRARVWLALCFIEREITIGTAKRSRIPNVLSTDLEHFTCQSQAHPPNMRLASLVEAVQTRDKFLSKISAFDNTNEDFLHQLRCVEASFEEWLRRWDALHKDCGYDASSFQRTSLYGQKRQAMIYIGCATIGRISGDRPLSEVGKNPSGMLLEVIRFVMRIALDHLRFILQSDSYKWHLRWATNYTVLSLTFASIFVLEISRQQNYFNAREIFSVVSGISQILVDHYNPSFCRLIRARLLQHPGAILNVEPHSAGADFEDHPVPSFSPKSAMENFSSLHQNHYDSQLQQPFEAAGEPSTPGLGLDYISNRNALDQLLETPDWMTNPSSMLMLDTSTWHQNDVFSTNA